MSDFVFIESQDSFSGFSEASGNVELFKEIAKGDKGDPGKDFQIQGKVDAVADLPTAQDIGEAWLVGTEAPYDGYLWDGTAWINIGPILEGPPGQDGDDYVLTQQDRTDIANIAVQAIEEDIQPQIDDLNSAISGLSDTIDAKILMPASAIPIPAAGSSASYDLTGLSSSHVVVRWGFSTSAENSPPCDLTVTTYEGYFTVSNTGGTTSESFTPVFAVPVMALVTTHS